MSLNATTGNISSSLIGGQGTYTPEFVVTDSTSAQATQSISISINGNNAFLANIFPSTSIFHHRVDAATTNLPVDTSPAAPMYSGYLSATVKPFFGNNSNAPFPNGIPAIEVPYNQADVSVTTTVISVLLHLWSNSSECSGGRHQQLDGDRHVLVYLEAGGGNDPALYEMWQGIYEGGPWTDSSNALWPDVTSNNLTPQGHGNIRCRRTSGSAAARQCRRGNRRRHTQRTDRHDSASHPIHTQPYVELLGLACYGNSGRGELHGYGREFDSRGIAKFRNLLLPKAAPCPDPLARSID
jgi:hypothetical protein